MDALTSSKFLSGTLGRWLASQGQYFKAINATPGTGQVSTVQASFSATSAFFLMQNTAPAGSNVYLFPDYVKFIVTVVDVVSAASAFQFVVAIDNALRYTSGGVQMVTPGTYAVNNGPVQTARIGPTLVKSMGPQTAVFSGTLVIAAESANAVRTARIVPKAIAAAGGVGVVNDSYLIAFSSGYDSGAGSTKVAATAGIYREVVGAHSIGPQGSLAMNFWAANMTTGVTMETEVGFWEAPAYPA